MEPRELQQQIAGVAALEDPVRRSLYFYVAYGQGDVGRDEAARAAGVSRALAGFHLDRLAAEGLLETSFRRLSGRAGPGAGRPAKLYRRSGKQLAVSLPQRSYDLAGGILAASLEAGGARSRGALRKTARAVGQRLGTDAVSRAGPRPGKKRLLACAVAALATQGYEPEQTAREIWLRNCPFHALVSEHKELVCGMNLALVEGVVGGSGLPGATPVLAPSPGRCCVSIRLKSGA